MPRVLLFDLDDTILRFTSGQPNFWQLALESQLACSAEQHPRLCAHIERVSDEYWSVPDRAFQGRQDLHAARRAIARAALLAEGLSHDLCERIADEVTDRKEAFVRPFDGAIDTLVALRERGH